MRRTVAAVALGLSVVSAAPADAGCLDDLVDERTPVVLAPLVGGTIRSNPDGSYTVQPNGPVAYAGGVAGSALRFVSCVS